MVKMNQHLRYGLYGFYLITCSLGLSLLTCTVSGDHIVNVHEGEGARIVCNSSLPNDVVQIDWISDETSVICTHKIKENYVESLKKEQQILLPDCSDGKLFIANVPRYFNGISFTLYTEDVFGQFNSVCSVKLIVHTHDQTKKKDSLKSGIQQDTTVIGMTSVTEEPTEHSTILETPERTTVIHTTSPTAKQTEQSTILETTKDTTDIHMTTETEEQTKHSTILETPERTTDIHTTTETTTSKTEEHSTILETPESTTDIYTTSETEEQTEHSTILETSQGTTVTDMTYCAHLGNESTTYALEEIKFPPENVAEQNKNLQAWFSRSHQNKYDVCYLKVLVEMSVEHIFIVNLTAVSYTNNSDDFIDYGEAFQCLEQHIEASCLEVKHPGLVTDGVSLYKYENTSVNIQAYIPEQDLCMAADINHLLLEIYNQDGMESFPGGFSLQLHDLPYGPDFGIYCVKGVHDKGLARQRALNMCMTGTNDDEVHLNETTLNNWAVKLSC